MTVYARRRIAATLLVVGVVVTVLAVADLGPFDDPPSAEEQTRADVEAAVDGFFDAAAEGDYAKFCGLLTEGTRRVLRSNAARLAGGEPTGNCARTLAGTLGEAFSGAAHEIKEISVSGTRARVVVNFRPPGSERQLPTVRLERVEGRWLISDPGF